MKRMANFRLTPHAIAVLVVLARTLKLSKTAVIERSLDQYARQTKRKANPLLACAGTFSDKTANEMLDTIYTHRHSKSEEFSL